MKNSTQISIFQNKEMNVAPTERAISVLSGSMMLYNSLAKKPKNYPQALLSAFMIYRGISGFCPGYKLAGKTLEPEKVSNITIKVMLTIDKPLYFVYQFWRKLENLPLFMKHLESVEIINDEISEWKMKTPGNLVNLSWKAAITNDIENKEISWRSFSDSFIHNIGKVTFADNGSFGTKMNVMISYQAPFGKSGEVAANVLNPIFETLVEQDVRRFKEYIENK